MDDLFSTPPQNNSQGINLDKPNDNIGSTNNSNGFGYGSTAYNSKPSSDYNNGNFGYGSTAYNAQQNNANSNSQFGYGETRTSNAYDNTGYSNNNAYGNSGYGNSGYNNNSYGNSGYGNSGYGNNSYNNDSYSNRGYDGGFSASPAFDGFGSSFERSAELMDYVKGVLGALIGALPGFLLFLVLGKFGIVAALSGGVLAIGMVAGFGFMTKGVSLSDKAPFIIYIVVGLVAVFMAEKIIYCSAIVEAIEKVVPNMQEMKNLYELAESAGMSKSEVDELMLDEYKTQLGISKITFGEIFSNFGRCLKGLGMNGKFMLSFLESCFFAALGAVGFLKKTGR